MADQIRPIKIARQSQAWLQRFSRQCPRAIKHAVSCATLQVKDACQLSSTQQEFGPVMKTHRRNFLIKAGDEVRADVEILPPLIMVGIEWIKQRKKWQGAPFNVFEVSPLILFLRDDVRTQSRLYKVSHLLTKAKSAQQ